MTSIRVKKYTPDDKPLWDSFVKQSKNATFLFYRDFMEYHSNRFNDFSLMIFEGKKLITLLPAHYSNSDFYSHLGLTYGGIIFRNFERISTVEKCFYELIRFLQINKFSTLTIKILPSIYNKQQSSGIEYFLFQQKANLIRRDLNFTVPLQNNQKLHKNKKKIYNKDFIKNLVIEETENLETFWNTILTPVLNDKYQTKPVHSLEEIEYLKQKFPNHIKQFNVLYDDKVIAGMTLFIDNKVVKSQYGTVNETGKKFKALDFLYLELFEKFKQEGFQYFDLGITNEDDGYSFNKGLTNYKEELGGIPVNLDRYLLSL